MHPSIANLSSRLHLCSGEVPPPLVGASSTLVEGSDHVTGKGAHLYLFGGRLVSSRRMVNTLYRLDLEQMRWSRLTPPTKQGTSVSETLQPQPRYFHSADLWRDKIVFFGGMGYSNRTGESSSDLKPDELCVLDELLVFDISQQSWDYSLDTLSSLSDPSASLDSLRPAPRYAHVSSLSGDSLVIIGGQNLANQYVESINVFHLPTQSWVGSHKFNKQCGSYRSLSVGTQYLYQQGEKAKCYPRGRDPLQPNQVTSHGQGSTADPSTQSRVEQNPLPLSILPKTDTPLPVYLYSNYNFTDVRRELEVLNLRPSASSAPSQSNTDTSQDSALNANMDTKRSQSAGAADLVSTQDRSKDMGGATLPPGLRFPTGALLGPNLLISGTYLANATQTFSVWALHLPTMVWSRIEAGSALSSGSWNRAILWPSKNRLVIVGHKERDLVSDYNHRQTNWDHVVVLELEAWGIYRPPISMLSEPAVQIGLDKLATSAPSALVPSATGNESDQTLQDPHSSRSSASSSSETLGGRGDFEIVCSDGLRIGCDRVILECRWPWFRTKMDDYRKRARRTLRGAFPSTATDQFGLRMIPEDIAEIFEVENGDDEDEDEEEAVDPLMTSSRNVQDNGKQSLKDPRFQPRHLQISEPSPVVLAFLQFLYSSRISTALQRHPAVVCALMVLAKTYNMEDLAIWSQHAAHVALADDLNPRSTAAGSRLSETLTPSSPDALDKSNAGLQLFRPAEALGLHPEERHRLAVCLYEAASLCGCEGLQIRALRVVMAIARWLQRHGSYSPNASGPGPGPESAGNGEGDRSTSRAPPSAAAASAPPQPPPDSHQSGTQSGSGYSASTTNRGAGGQTRISNAVEIQDTPRPLPVLTMSRSGSESASSQGPLTPNLLHQGFRDRRNDSLSSTDGESSSSWLAQDPETDTAAYKWHIRSSDLYRKKRDQSLGFVSQTQSRCAVTEVEAPLTDTQTTAYPLRQSSHDMRSLEMRLDSFTLQRPHVPAKQSTPERVPLSPRSSIDGSSEHSQSPLSYGEQYRVNAYGPQPGLSPSKQRSYSLSTSQSGDASAIQDHLPNKKPGKLEQEQKKQQAKEEKARRKAEKAEYKRLAAEAVFGPKGSTGPTSASSSDFVTFAGRASTGTSSRRGSELSDTTSAGSKSDGRTSSLGTNRSLHSLAPAPMVRGGEWSIATATTTSPWFSGPPPPVPRYSVS